MAITEQAKRVRAWVKEVARENQIDLSNLRVRTDRLRLYGGGYELGAAVLFVEVDPSSSAAIVDNVLRRSAYVWGRVVRSDLHRPDGRGLDTLLFEYPHAPAGK